MTRPIPHIKAKKPIAQAMTFSEAKTTIPAAMVSRKIPAPSAVQFLELPGLPTGWAASGEVDKSSAIFGPSQFLKPCRYLLLSFKVTSTDIAQNHEGMRVLSVALCGIGRLNVRISE